MCVIMVADQDVRVTEEMVRLGYMKNSAGAGVAWREKGKVHWMKGIDLTEVQALNKTLPFPYVLHFRLPSSGTTVGPFGCHPFPVAEDSPYSLKGIAPKGVLFHNGFWADWRNKLLTAAIDGGWKLPDGPYTDTRALAITAAHIDGGFLELVNEKTVWFTDKEVRIYGEFGGHNGWVEVNKITCSNRSWESSIGGGRQTAGFTQGTSAASTQGTGVTTETAGGASHQDSFRRNTDSSGEGGGDQQEASEEGAEETVRGAMVHSCSKGRLILYPGEKLCGDCQNAVARVCTWQDAIATHRCWPCHSQHTGDASPSRQSYLDGGGGHLSVLATSRCQYCFMNDGQHVMTSSNKVICPLCWLKMDKPSTMGLQHDDPRVKTN